MFSGQLMWYNNCIICIKGLIFKHDVQLPLELVCNVLVHPGLFLLCLVYSEDKQYYWKALPVAPAMDSVPAFVDNHHF